MVYAGGVLDSMQDTPQASVLGVCRTACRTHHTVCAVGLLDSTHAQTAGRAATTALVPHAESRRTHLDVPVDAVVLVHVLDRLQHRQHDGGNHNLVQTLQDSSSSRPAHQ
jgi:hypothetical protein